MRTFSFPMIFAPALVVGFANASVEKDTQVYRERRERATPESVMRFLKDGNARFMKGQSTHGGYPADARERRNASATGQRPLAAVLSCIDSRTTPELVFDTSVGDLFTARVGANVVNDDVLGSLEIAVESGAKVVVVLGHTDCGGIKAACNNLVLEHMTQLLERIKPAIIATNKRLDGDAHLSKLIGEHQASNPAYVAEVSHANAQSSAKQIRERSQVLRQHIDRGEIKLLSAVYHVDTGEVVFDEL